MAKGKIKTYLEEKGFGFISPEKGGEDVFFHVNELNDRGYGVEPGAPVEYDTKPGRKPGEVKAVRVRVLDFAPESPPESSPDQTSDRSDSSAALPEACIFRTFYGKDGHLEPRIFFDAAEKAALAFEKQGFTPSQFRQLFQGFMSFAGPLSEDRIDFATAKERFGAFYAERVVRQTRRNSLKPIVKALIDAHRELALTSQREMLGLYRFIKYIYCYFDKPTKN